MIEYRDYMDYAMAMCHETSISSIRVCRSIRKLYRNEKTYKFFEYGAMCVVRV